MDEARFRPPVPIRTARVLLVSALVVAVVGIAAWTAAGLVPLIIAAVAAIVLVVLALRLFRVELILTSSGIEVIDVTGTRRQAWVGTQRLMLDFSRPRPLLEIDAPGPGQPYRSTLVLAGFETEEHAETRARIEELLQRWCGPNVTLDVRPPEAAASS